jgi:hypothetical protein
MQYALQFIAMMATLRATATRFSQKFPLSMISITRRSKATPYHLLAHPNVCGD